MVQVGQHLRDRGRRTRHLQPDVEALQHGEVALGVGDPGAGDVHAQVRADGLGEAKAVVADVGDHDVLGPGMADDRCGEDPDRACAGDQHILPDGRPLQRCVGGVAQRVEDGAQFRVDRRRLQPDVGRRQHDVVGERAVGVHPEPHGVDAHVTASGPAVAAASADDVALPGRTVTDLQARDVLADLDDLAVELVADDQRRDDGARRPVVPGLQVQVGAAQPRPQHPQLHLVRPAVGFGDIDQFQTRAGGRLHQRTHELTLSPRQRPARKGTVPFRAGRCLLAPTRAEAEVIHRSSDSYPV